MRIPSLLSGLLMCALCVPLARAQEPDHDRFITQALSAYDGGRYAEARTLFRRAHELEPTARTFRTIGMCSFNLGDYVDALQNLEAALVDKRKPLTEDQRTHVAGLIERGNAEIGRFRLKLSPPDATILADGAPAVLLDRKELLLEPGRHVIVTSADGYRASQRELTVERHDRATLELRLEPISAAEKAASAPPAAPVAVPPGQGPAPQPAAAPKAATAVQAESGEQQGTSTRAVLGYVGIGLGAAGIATFAIAGGLALAKKGKLDSQCPDRQCGPQQHAAVDAYDGLKTTATVGLIGGVALFSVGAVLLWTGNHEAEASQAALEPQIGLGWAGLRGTL